MLKIDQNLSHLGAFSTGVGPGFEGCRPVPESLPPRAIEFILAGQYAQAYELLDQLPRSLWVRNTLAVCGLRCGRIDQAVAILRGLALNPGTTVVRSDADDIVLINFATALMMSGLPSGAIEILSELHDPLQLPAIRIRSAIVQWSDSLPFWRRWDWKINRIDPPQARVPIDFLPGEFHFVLEPARPTGPLAPGSNTPKLAA